MRKISRNAMLFKSARSVAMLIFVPVFVVSMASHSVHAEEDPKTQLQTEEPNGHSKPEVEAPNLPMAVSNADDPVVVWQWAAPAGGLTPDVSTVVGDESTELPTDIILYGYEVSNEKGIQASGQVSTDTPAVTTEAKSNGTYSIKVWSITRAQNISAPAIGTVTINSPSLVIPENTPIVVPLPIDTSSVTKVEAVGSVNVEKDSSSPKQSPQRPNVDNNSAGVLSSNNSPEVKSINESTVAVAPSKNGWVIFGTAWYVWFVVIIALLAFIRLCTALVKKNINTSQEVLS